MFKDNLKTTRNAKGYSQKDLAKALFVSQQAVSLWETGKGYPDVPTLKALADFLGVETDELIGSKEFVDAKENKKTRSSPIWIIVFAVSLVLISLLAVFLALTCIYSGFGNYNAIAGALLLFCVALIAPAFYAVYKKKAKGLVLSGMIGFGVLFSAFLGLCISDFASVGLSSVAGWEWLSCSLVTGFGFGFFVYFYSRGKGINAASSQKHRPDPSMPIEKRTRNLSCGWGWAGLSLTLLFLVLFSVPWLAVRAVLPGVDGQGNQIFMTFEHYFSMAYLLWESKVFLAMDFVLPMTMALTLVFSSILLFKKLTASSVRKISGITVIMAGMMIICFFIGLLLSFVSMPTY